MGSTRSLPGVRRTPATVVTGTQWGDEGKGKVVDYLAGAADVVVRYNGGANAGHTVYAGERKFAFHLVPSGIARPGMSNVICAGVAVDPEVLVGEVRNARAAFGKVKLLLSERAHVVTPYHKLRDELEEGRRAAGFKIGTTKRGIGPTYQDKAARTGIRVCDLLDARALREKVRATARRTKEEAEGTGAEVPPAKGVVEGLLKSARALRPFVGDSETFLWDAHEAGQQILLEGAHGMMLDLDFGTYPFVTSSSCTAGGAAAQSGLPPSAITRSVGVVKAYTTRVGEGPFPTELGEKGGGKWLRERGGEYGTTTGRPRRCGWLDLVIVRRAARLSGLTDIALTKLDVLAGLKPLKVCVGYKLDGRATDRLPAKAADLEHCKPVLQEVAPIPKVDLKALARRRAGLSQLPAEARAYIELIEKHAGCPVTIVGVGPSREELLVKG